MRIRGFKTTLLCTLYSTHAFAAGDKAHGEYPEVSGLPQLDTSTYPSQVFWLVVVFVAMYFFFAKKSLPAISGTIENRSERINNDLDSAERLKDEVTSVQQSYEESLAEARGASDEIFQNIEKEIKEKSEEQAAMFQKRSSEQMINLEKNISTARDKAMEEMSDIAAEVATEAAAKIIGVKANKGDAKAVIDALNKKAA